MSDLLQSQIKESCKLGLPNGLKELMSDISREVLRAQPANLYDFITKYLAALLVTRENLNIGQQLTQQVYDFGCCPELEQQLRNIGLDEENVTEAVEIIEGCFKEGKVDENNLLMELMSKINFSEDQLEPLQETIRNAFLLHQIRNTKETAALDIPSVEDDISRAAMHTLQLYEHSGPTEEEYNRSASRIQATYRAYAVQRLCGTKLKEQKILVTDDDSSPCPSMYYIPPGPLFYNAKKNYDTKNSPSGETVESSRPQSGVSNKQSTLRFSEIQEIIHITSAHDSSSFEAKECTSKSTNDKWQSNSNSYEDDEISGHSEYKYRQFYEKGSNEALYDYGLASVSRQDSVDNIEYTMKTLKYNIYVGKETDSPGEQNIKEKMETLDKNGEERY